MTARTTATEAPTLAEWSQRHPNGNLVGLRLRAPDGKEYTLRGAWRVGEPPAKRVGLWLLPPGQTQGVLTTKFSTWDGFMSWRVIE